MVARGCTLPQLAIRLIPGSLFMRKKPIGYLGRETSVQGRKYKGNNPKKTRGGHCGDLELKIKLNIVTSPLRVKSQRVPPLVGNPCQGLPKGCMKKETVGSLRVEDMGEICIDLALFSITKESIKEIVGMAAVDGEVQI